MKSDFLIRDFYPALEHLDFTATSSIPQHHNMLYELIGVVRPPPLTPSSHSI